MSSIRREHVNTFLQTLPIKPKFSLNKPFIQLRNIDSKSHIERRRMKYREKKCYDTYLLEISSMTLTSIFFHLFI